VKGHVNWVIILKGKITDINTRFRVLCRGVHRLVNPENPLNLPKKPKKMGWIG